MYEHELNPDALVTRFRDLDIYQIHAVKSPEVMAEIGRIREREFSRDGGGTGKDLDIDEFDAEPYCYQLLVWDPRHREIVAFYRYLPLWLIPPHRIQVGSPSSRLFRFSEEFETEILPYCIELGRSVVNRDAKRKFLGLFAIWSGLGALIWELPEARWLFGKLTVYPQVRRENRRRLSAFWARYFPGKAYMAPRDLVDAEAVDAAPGSREADVGTDVWADYPPLDDRVGAFERISRELAAAGDPVPPLMKSYLGVSLAIQSFGTAVNPHFGNVYETAILLPIGEINEATRRTFIDTYQPLNSALFQPLRIPR
jgi:hypothetical protein